MSKLRVGVVNSRVESSDVGDSVSVADSTVISSKLSGDCKISRGAEIIDSSVEDFAVIIGARVSGSRVHGRSRITGKHLLISNSDISGDTVVSGVLAVSDASISSKGDVLVIKYVNNNGEYDFFSVFPSKEDVGVLRCVPSWREAVDAGKPTSILFSDYVDAFLGTWRELLEQKCGCVEYRRRYRTIIARAYSYFRLKAPENVYDKLNEILELHREMDYRDKRATGSRSHRSAHCASN